MNTLAVKIKAGDVYVPILVGIMMMLAINLMPSTLGALAQEYNLDASKLSLIASTEMISFVLATTLTSNKDIAGFRALLIVGGFFLTTSNLSLALFPEVSLIAARAVAGVGAGIGLSFTLKVCAMSERPTRSFGIFTGTLATVQILGFQGIAYLMSLQTEHGLIDVANAKGVVKTIFTTYALLAFLAIFIYLSNKSSVPAKTGAERLRKHMLPSSSVMIGLFAIVITFVGQGSVFVFLQTLGISHGFSFRSVTNAISIYPVMAIFGGFVAACLPNNIPRWIAIGIALLVLCGGLYALYLPQNVWWFAIGCAITGFYGKLVLPLMLGLLASIDHTGQGPVLGGAMSSAGSAIGPLFAGLLIHNSNYTLVGLLVGTLCFIGFSCVFFVERYSSSEKMQ